MAKNKDGTKKEWNANGRQPIAPEITGEDANNNLQYNTPYEVGKKYVVHNGSYGVGTGWGDNKIFTGYYLGRNANGEDEFGYGEDPTEKLSDEELDTIPGAELQEMARRSTKTTVRVRPTENNNPEGHDKRYVYSFDPNLDYEEGYWDNQPEPVAATKSVTTPDAEPSAVVAKVKPMKQVPERTAKGDGPDADVMPRQVSPVSQVVSTPTISTPQSTPAVEGKPQTVNEKTMSKTKDVILNNGDTQSQTVTTGVATDANTSGTVVGADAGTDGTTPGAVTTPTATQTAQQKRPSYAEMYQQINPYKMPTPDEVEAQRKKERRDKMFAAIGDGISALSNLYFTTKGAPNAYDPRHTMSEKVRARYDKLQKDFEQNSRAWTQGYLQAQKMDADAGYRDFLMKLKEDDNKRKERAQKAKDDYNEARLDGLIEKNKGEELKNEKLRLQNELAQETNPLRVQLLHKQIAKADKAIEKMDNDMKNNNARTHKYVTGGGRGSGGSKHDVIYTPDGTYDVPTGFMAKNRGALMKAAGVEGTENHYGTKRNKSISDIDKEIQEKWNDKCTEILVNGGSYRQGSNASVKPGKNSKGSSSGGSSASSGSRGSGSASGSSSSKGKKKINW